MTANPDWPTTTVQSVKATEAHTMRGDRGDRKVKLYFLINNTSTE